MADTIDADALRARIATAVWLVAGLMALTLAVGALLVTLDANPDNAMVGWVLDAAGLIDWFFWRIFELGDSAQDHLVNWGLAAVSYLAIGYVAERLIRP